MGTAVRLNSHIVLSTQVEQKLSQDNNGCPKIFQTDEFFNRRLIEIRKFSEESEQTKKGLWPRMKWRWTICLSKLICRVLCHGGRNYILPDNSMTQKENWKLWKKDAWKLEWEYMNRWNHPGWAVFSQNYLLQRGLKIILAFLLRMRWSSIVFGHILELPGSCHCISCFSGF